MSSKEQAREEVGKIVKRFSSIPQNKLVPSGLRIMHEKHSKRVSQIAKHWIFLNKSKAILSLVGWLAALKAFFLLGGLQ